MAGGPAGAGVPVVTAAVVVVENAVTAWSRCSRCGLVLCCRPGDESGPIVRLLAHRKVCGLIRGWR